MYTHTDLNMKVNIINSKKNIFLFSGWDSNIKWSFEASLSDI